MHTVAALFRQRSWDLDEIDQVNRPTTWYHRPVKLHAAIGSGSLAPYSSIGPVSILVRHNVTLQGIFSSSPRFIPLTFDSTSNHRRVSRSRKSFYSSLFWGQYLSYSHPRVVSGTDCRCPLIQPCCWLQRRPLRKGDYVPLLYIHLHVSCASTATNTSRSTARALLVLIERSTNVACLPG